MWYSLINKNIILFFFTTLHCFYLDWILDRLNVIVSVLKEYIFKYTRLYENWGIQSVAWEQLC